MAIPILNHMDFQKSAEIRNVRLHNQASSGVTSPGTGQILYDSGTLKYYNGSSWISIGTSSGSMSQWILEDDDGTEVSISNNEEVKFIGSGITTNWTDTSDGSDGDPFDLTFTVDAAQTGITSILATDLKIGEDDETKIDFETADEIHFYAANVEQVYLGDNIFGPQSDSDVDLGSTSVRWKDAYVDSITVTGEVDGASLDISGNADIDGTLEADAYTVDGVALNEYIADTVGAMVSGNTETRIAVSYDDSDNTLDFVVNDMTANDNDDVSNANLLTRLAALESTSGAADENITIGADSGDTIVITGNLQVSGTTTTVNSTTVNLNDHNIVLDSGNSTSAVVDGGGITLEGGSGDDATWTYNASSNAWESKLGSSYEDIKGAKYTGTELDISGNIDIDGTANLDAVDIDGAVQIDSTVTVGVDDTGYDVKFFGDTASKYLLWDASEDTLYATGEIDAGSLDISGDADIDGTLEADAITVNGTALSEYIADTAGGMVTGNTETGITVTYQDGDNTIDFVVSDTTVAGDSGSTGMTPGDTLTIAGGSNITTAMSGDTLTITGTDTNTQLSTAAALVDVSAMAGNSVASFTHSLGSKNLLVQLYDTTSGLVVHADVDHTSNNAISITFANTGTELAALGIGDIRVVVVDAVNGLTDKTVSYS